MHRCTTILPLPATSRVIAAGDLTRCSGRALSATIPNQGELVHLSFAFFRTLLTCSTSHLSSRSYSSHSATSSTNLPCYAPSIEYQGNDFKDDAMYSHQLKERPTPAKPPILKSTTIRNEAASHVMHVDQRQHSTVSTASSAISSKSHTSISSNHSRMTSKFPVPRLLCSGGSARPGFHENTSSKLLLSRPEAAKVRADVAAQIAQQDAREQKARWTKAKWLLLLSVAAVGALFRD